MWEVSNDNGCVVVHYNPATEKCEVSYTEHSQLYEWRQYAQKVADRANHQYVNKFFFTVKKAS